MTIPLSELKPGNKVKGKTIAELGNRNRPLDMIVYKGKDGKEYTSHFAVSPRFQLKETCLKCHKDWNEEQARYAMFQMPFRLIEQHLHMIFYRQQQPNRFSCHQQEKKSPIERLWFCTILHR